MDGGDASAEIEPLASDRAPETGVVSKTSQERNSASLSSRDNDRPPDDDCCPICFGDYNIPCKTSCGHWFCACCILMFWSYSKSVLRRCKCPICCRLINKFTPEASVLLQQDDEVIKTLDKVWDYNDRFGGGTLALLMKVYLLSVTRTFAEGFRDPNRVGINVAVIRAFALLLAILYKCCGFDFIPAGNRDIIDLFGSVATFLALGVYLAIDFHDRRARRPAENHQD